jgi:cyclophilin family peptidyl-prolyl cis-trans isomerase/HEAT repeat protein
MRTKYLFAVLILMLFAACAQPEKTADLPESGPPNKFSDSTLVEIYEMQDRRDANGLQSHLKSKEGKYRAAAAMAFGSVQDTNSIPLLISLLSDGDKNVQTAAAWALGQTGHASAGDALLIRMRIATDAELIKALGEAIGKCGDSSHLATLLESAANMNNLQAGAMQGLYRAGLRKMAGPETMDFAVSQLQSSDSATVLYAAAFFGRNRRLAPIEDPTEIIAAIHEIKDPDALQHLVRALARTESPLAIAELRSLMASADSDYRVKVSAIRAMTEAPQPEYYELMTEAATDKNIHIALEAANYLFAHTSGKKNESRGNQLLLLSDKASHWRTSTRLLAAAMKMAVTERNQKVQTAIETEALSRFDASKIAYEKGHYLLAMAESPRMEQAIVDHLLTDKGVVRTYAMEALATSYAGTKRRKAKARIINLKSAMELDDIAVAALVAGLIRQEKALLKAAGDGAFLREAMERLSLPEDIETYNEIERTLAAISGESNPVVKPVAFNNPIDWDFVKKLPADLKCTMRLTNGHEIRIQMLVEDAPASVANFVSFAQSGFYDNAVYHRVIPNFVAQGGDPRGDGWGSTPNTIRSEWPQLHYGEGYMGMASAGKDTESCQWFITHCSTPHLDGRYTIFAKVVSGMEFIHQVNIGDRIESISFPDLPSNNSKLNP